MTRATLGQARVKCGFCSFPSKDEPHAHCPIAVQNGNGTQIIRCGCDCTAHLVKCMRCGSRESLDNLDRINPETWACVDPDECAATIERRLAADPTVQMIRRFQEQAGERVKVERLTRPASSARPSSGACLHCGEPTKGGKFLPGHDATFLSSAIKSITAGDATLQEVLDTWAGLGVSEALQGKLHKRASA